MLDISSQIQNIVHRMQLAAESAGRSPCDVKLLLVSKKQPVDAIRQAYDAGISDFGENYWQEAGPKIKALADLPINWHFIGPIQSNKCKFIAPNFSWVHSVSKPSVLEGLNRHRPMSLPPLNICLQMNISGEATKSGVLSFDALETLAKATLSYPRLKLCGLMGMPEPGLSEPQSRQRFELLHHRLSQLNQRLNLNCTTLSMGMSHDFEAAIRAGSTWVRIGSLAFGER